tara:strand:- start:229 stop:876 length:648 start_codon:yes stop_codon:yes gene_type:complete
MNTLPSVVSAIIIFNILLSFLGFKNQAFFNKYQFKIAKIKAGDKIRMWSSGFLHLDFNHLFINMLSFYFFAGYVVYSLGEIKFLVLYLSSLYLGNYLSFRYHNQQDNYTAVGASGAVSGVVYSSILLYPDMKMIFIFFPIPLPSYVMAAIYMFYTIYGIRKQSDNIGHTAHFGGAITGILATIVFIPSVIIESGFTLCILGVTLIFAAFMFRHKH